MKINVSSFPFLNFYSPTVAWQIQEEKGNQMSNGGGEEEDQEELSGLAPERIAVNLSLHIAAADGNIDECEKLLKEESADAWWEDESRLNWSALHFAANGGYTKVVQLLLRRGALWNAGEATKVSDRVNLD